MNINSFIRNRAAILIRTYEQQIGNIMRENSRRTIDYFSDGRSDDLGDGPSLLSEDLLSRKVRICRAVIENARINDITPDFSFQRVEWWPLDYEQPLIHIVHPHFRGAEMPLDEEEIEY